ncbi:MAG TPA: histidine kinase [Gaiellaceae bacterium]|nr:histidine kinase [Gaiellaceae bacterium]
MRRGLESFVRNQRVQGVGDTLLAVALALSSVLPVLARNDPSWGRPKALGVSLALLSTVPIAWRARRPLLAATLVLVANAACVYAAVPHDAAFQPFLALLLASYSAGSRAEGPRATWVPPVLALAAIPMFAAAIAHGQSAGNAGPSYVFLIVAWAVGRTVRSWRHKTIELEAANRELEEQRELQAQAAVAVERGRIARELHDVIAHNVSMIVVQAGAAARVLAGDESQVHAALSAIEATGRETVDEMRRLLGVLRRADDGLALAPQPGLRDLESLVAHVREAGLPVELSFEGEPVALPPGIELSAYRIVQESLTNALKHAGRASAEVTVRYETGAVELEIRDDGDGSGRGGGTGHGLVGMRERVALWGGRLDAGSREGGGWAVRARLPVGSSAG